MTSLRLPMLVTLLCFFLLHVAAAPPDEPKLTLNARSLFKIRKVSNFFQERDAANQGIDNASTNSTSTQATGVSGPVIDFLLSNWWNNTQYLAQSNPGVAFNGANNTYPSSSQNSTVNQTTIFGIDIAERRQYQTMVGLGGGLTDATAIVLQALRGKYPDAYTEILNLLFNESPEWLAKGGAGLNMLRLPIGASDFGFQEYTYDNTVDGSNDTTLSQFNIDKSPKRWQTIQDILKINPRIIVIAAPWSQPAWMKNSTNNTQGSLHGGSVRQEYEGVFGDYLVKFVQTLQASKGITVNALSLQNEPLYDGADYPCTKMLPDQQARIGKIVRQKLDAAKLKVDLYSFDHNWDTPQYPVEVFDDAAEAFHGVAWHCYAGKPSGQRPFNDAYPNKSVWFTECTRITQNYEEPWQNIKKSFDQLVIGSVNYYAETVILWNLALQTDRDGFTIPSLPKTCKNCLAPILVFDNSTGELEGLNRSAVEGREPQPNPPSRRAFTSYGISDYLKRASNQAQTSSASLANLNPAGPMNSGASNGGLVIPPSQSTYYRSSDFVLLAHLGRAIRPNNQGKRFAQRIGVMTTEDRNENPRVKAQVFRNDLGNGSSRWSLIVLQQLDHYGYNLNSPEDATMKIRFRDSVATIALPPGVYTLQWTAENSDFEKKKS